MIIVTSEFLKSSFFKTFSVHTKTKSRHFQIPSVWKAYRRKKKVRFRDELVCTLDLTAGIKLRFLTDFSDLGPDYMSRAGVSLPGSRHVC